MPSHRPIVLLAVLLAACSDPEVDSQSAPLRTDALDVLVVVDSSPSMAEEQASLRDRFDRIIAELEQFPGGLPDIHIGVISTDLGAGPEVLGIGTCGAFPGDGGVLTGEPRLPDCAPPTDPFIADERAADGSRRRNYEGDMMDAFACIASLGDQGCGFEQPLAAVERALADPTGANLGFHRPGAALALIILTDEDDCSATDAALFDPAREDLGELSSFRCALKGLSCDGGPVGSGPARYEACQPAEDSAYVVDPAAVAQAVTDHVGYGGDVMVSVIAGDRGPLVVEAGAFGLVEVTPSCESENGLAVGAYRLGAFAESFEHNLFRSICSTDLGPVLTETGAMFREAMLARRAR